MGGTRRELQQLRLHMLANLDIMGLREFFTSDAFAVCSDSRRWLAEGAMEHVQASSERVLEKLWRRCNDDAEEHDVPLQWLQAANYRQAKHHAKVAQGKRRKEQRKKETRREEAMRHERDRQTAARVRARARRSCMRR